MPYYSHRETIAILKFASLFWYFFGLFLPCSQFTWYIFAPIFLGGIDYFRDQSKVKMAFDKVYQNEYVVKSSVSSWYEGYIGWVNKTYGNTPYVDASK